MLDKYFVSKNRNVMNKKTSHLWVINSMILAEFIEFCESDGQKKFDDRAIHGKVVDWKEGGNRHRNVKGTASHEEQKQTITKDEKSKSPDKKRVRSAGKKNKVVEEAKKRLHFR